MRGEIEELVRMGPLPASDEAVEDVLRLEEFQRLIQGIEEPPTSEKVRALATLFGPDECFGLAWALVHLIESHPAWPQLDLLPNSSNPWIELLRDRAARRFEE